MSEAERRSIFSPQERSQSNPRNRDEGAVATSVSSNAGRDLTRSARVRAVKLQSSLLQHEAPKLDDASPNKPGYRGQRTSNRLSPSGIFPNNSDRAGLDHPKAVGKAQRAVSSNVALHFDDEREGSGGEESHRDVSPGAWALKHAKELAAEDDLVEDDDGEGDGIEAVMMTSLDELTDGARGASASSGAAVAAGLPPRPYSSPMKEYPSSLNSSASHDLSYRSRSESEGGETVPMSNLLNETEDGDGDETSANITGADESAIGALHSDIASPVEVILSPELRETKEFMPSSTSSTPRRYPAQTASGTNSLRSTPRHSNAALNAPGSADAVAAYGTYRNDENDDPPITPSGGYHGRTVDVVAPTNTNDRAGLALEAVNIGTPIEPVSPVTPGDRDGSARYRYGSLGTAHNGSGGGHGSGSGGLGDEDQIDMATPSLDGRSERLNAHQFDNVSKLSMDDVLDASSSSQGCPPPPSQPTLHARKHHLQPDDPTIHLQSLLLAIAFLFIWSPQNLMAPNLTQMAEFFGFSPEQRDLYLGAYIAFATGVLSLPVSGAIGFVADLVTSRKRLYALTCLVAGIAAILTGLSQTYAQLYFARFVCGGCMSGSVPIVFSLLGDLFDSKDRNAASAGLTAMMGGGILLGQVYAGCVGSQTGWRGPFYVSGGLTIVSAVLVQLLVKEPVRGGKEKVLQDMLASGAKYDKKLTLEDFLHALLRNRSNGLLIWFGFFTSIPWGVIFTFLNDYLSQEQAMSVPDATMLVLWFGIGCALGGILGGYLGQISMSMDRGYLPLLMATSTFLGIFPFLALLNGPFHTADPLACFFALLGGCVANLPSVNMRPCIINVNAPEVRGASLNASNIAINLARGAGPSCITIMGAIWGVSRQFSFNLTLIVFWLISAMQLVFLSKTLPHDQDAMEAELAKYVESALGKDTPSITSEDSWSIHGDESLVSIEERQHFFDAKAAEQSLLFLGEAFKEVDLVLHRNKKQQPHPLTSIDNGEALESARNPPSSRKSGAHDLRRNMWRKQQHKYEPINEETELRVGWNDDPIEKVTSKESHIYAEDDLKQNETRSLL